MLIEASWTQGSGWTRFPGCASRQSLELPVAVKTFFVVPELPAGTNDSLLSLVLASEPGRSTGRAYGLGNEASTTAAQVRGTMKPGHHQAKRGKQPEERDAPPPKESALRSIVLQGSRPTLLVVLPRNIPHDHDSRLGIP